MQINFRVRDWATSALVIVIAATLMIAVSVRFGMLSKHFTDIDDIGVATTIMEADRNIADVSDLRVIINNQQLRQYNTFKFKALRQVDSLGILGSTFDVLAVFRGALAVPLRWSYAPGQYLLTPWFLHHDASYQRSLATGRAPSALFSLMAIALIGFSAWKLEDKDNVVATAFALVMPAISLEFFSFSVHMSNYAAGVFASAALSFTVLGRRLDGPPISCGVKLGLLLFVLILLSYQVLILVPAALVAIALSATKDSQAFSKPAHSRSALLALWQTRAVRAVIIAGAVFATLLLPTFVFLMSSIQPITWNSGPHNEFAFNWHLEPTIVGTILYPLHFISWNFLQIFAAMLSPVPEESPAYWPIALAFLILFIVGLIALLRNPSGTRRFAFGSFVLLAFLTYVVMALFKLLAMSPTRHALIFLPLFAITISAGATVVLKTITSNPAIRARLSAVALAIILFTSIYYLPSELTRRRDPFDESTLSSIIESTGARIVAAYDHTYNVELMPSIRSKVALFNQQNLNFPWLDGRLPNRPTPILFISQRHTLTASDLTTLLDEMNRSLPQDMALSACLYPADILRHDVKVSNVSFETSHATQSATSGYFATVLKTRPPEEKC